MRKLFDIPLYLFKVRVSYEHTEWGIFIGAKKSQLRNISTGQYDVSFWGLTISIAGVGVSIVK